MLLIRVALTITTLLAMSTTTSSINSSLPPVAYTKVYIVNNIFSNMAVMPTGTLAPLASSVEMLN